MEMGGSRHKRCIKKLHGFWRWYEILCRNRFHKVQMAVFLHCLVTKYTWQAIKGGDIVQTPGLQFPNGFHVEENVFATRIVYTFCYLKCVFSNWILCSSDTWIHCNPRMWTWLLIYASFTSFIGRLPFG
ncbi:Uncharacterized protein Adt_13284 [Abeliophyllum distichum]|uniref:Uncharacterized protein n=1 Tax=Abeliophyllum distichum TaxID=126358 RepID=A0ABD1TWC9_9LAMI